MPGRTYNAGTEYRYGFNGQERSTEINDNSFTAEFWQYDSRIGRRWNVDPVYKHSPYECFGGNPIWFGDPNGADTSLPSAGGGKIRLDGNVSDIKTFDGTSQKIVGGTTIKPASGTLKSFTFAGKGFISYFNTTSGSFAGYFTTLDNGSLQSYNDFEEEYDKNAPFTIDDLKRMFNFAIGAAKWAYKEGTPIKDVDVYGSMQIKDDQSITNFLPKSFVEDTKFTWTLLGIQGGYNTANGGGWYASAATITNSYFNAKLVNGDNNRISPFSKPIWQVGNSNNSGDFNIVGRTLITLPLPSKSVEAQLDFVYGYQRFQAGFRTKGEVPIGKFFGGNQKFEVAFGARAQFKWPNYLQNLGKRFLGQ